MTQEQKELLRIEYYKVMEYSQPFGNEHHEELFKWFISKIKEAEWQKQDIEATEKIIKILSKEDFENACLNKPEPPKQQFIDRKKLHECILKDDILVSMRSQVEQLLKDIDKRYAYLIDLYKDL